MVVLKLLSDESLYTYRIGQKLKEKSNGQFTMSFLYPVLYRLEELGCVEVTDQTIEENRVRNYYGITDKGRKYLKELENDYLRMSAVLNDLMDFEKQ